MGTEIAAIVGYKPGLVSLGQEIRFEKFVREYVATTDVVKAYRVIEPESEYTEAGRRGRKLLKRVVVRAMVARERERLAEVHGIEVGRLVAEAKKLAFSDVTDVVSWDGRILRIRSSEELEEAARGAIKSVKETEHGLEVVMHGKETALRMLGTTVGVFGERLDVSVHQTVDLSERARAVLEQMRVVEASHEVVSE